MLGLLLTVAGCSMNGPVAHEALPSRVETLPYYDTRTFTPHWMEPAEVPSDFHHIPSFQLTDQHDESVTESVMDGKITVASFFFTRCGGICPTMTKNLKTVDAAFDAGEDVLLLTHSVMPSTDTVPALRTFVSHHDIDSERWHFLTGDRSVIYRLGRQAYFAEEDLGEARTDDDFLHTENVVVVDGHRRIRGVYNGLDTTSVEQLIVDVRTLLAEKES